MSVGVVVILFNPDVEHVRSLIDAFRAPDWNVILVDNSPSSMFAIAVAELSESSPRPQYRRQVHINSVTRYVFGIAKAGNRRIS